MSHTPGPLEGPHTGAAAPPAGGAPPAGLLPRAPAAARARSLGGLCVWSPAAASLAGTGNALFREPLSKPRSFLALRPRRPGR